MFTYYLSNIIVSTYNTPPICNLNQIYDKKLQISVPQQQKQEKMYLIYYNYSPNFAEGTTKIIDDLESNQLIFKMQLPNEAEFILPNLVLPIIVFLALGLGVGIGSVVSICSNSICLVKFKERKKILFTTYQTYLIVSTYNTPPTYLWPKPNMTKSYKYISGNNNINKNSCTSFTTIIHLNLQNEPTES